MGVWLTPFRVVVAGFLVALVVALWPISFLGPGSHEMTDCGNLLWFDSHGYGTRSDRDDYYWGQFVRRCDGGKVDRLVVLGCVVAVTGAFALIARRPD